MTRYNIRTNTCLEYLLDNHLPQRINWLWRHTNTQGTNKYKKHPLMKYAKDKTLETIRFPFNSFRYSLTLFSKFFSSFPHGTCSLSVSHLYLALDGIYHLLWAAFPSNSTQRKRIVHTSRPEQRREYHPLCCPFPRDLFQVAVLTTASIDYNSPC
jgi:hypothetical protein